MKEDKSPKDSFQDGSPLAGSSRVCTNLVFNQPTQVNSVWPSLWVGKSK